MLENIYKCINNVILVFSEGFVSCDQMSETVYRRCMLDHQSLQGLKLTQKLPEKSLYEVPWLMKLQK